MNNRVLLVVSILVAVFAVWFYRNQGELDSIINLSKNNIEYQATDILAIQTNEDGIAEYALIADDLTHYNQENLDILQQMTLHWRPNMAQTVMITANEAKMYHEQAKVVMSDNVVFASRDDSLPSGNEIDVAANPAMTAKPPMTLMAKELIGDLNTNLLYSVKPIRIEQGENVFQSENFTADMNTGNYQFDKVAVVYMPPPRKDTPLF